MSLHGDICMQDILMRELYRPKYVQEYQTATSTPSLWMMATKMEILDGKESCLTKNVCVQAMLIHWDSFRERIYSACFFKISISVFCC